MTDMSSSAVEISTPQKIVNWLFREQELSLGFLEWLKVLSATLIIRNRQFSQGFFDALSKKISASFIDPHLSPLKKDLILYNALSYIPFADPQEGQILTIKGIDYSIEKIALTSGWLSSTYYAYGLKARTDTGAPSYLIFQGTTTPSDHGFLAGLLADTRPVGSIGTQLYARGQQEIQKWIRTEFARTNKPVRCTGQSLGGAMSLHAHIHQPEAVDYFIMNPPGLTNREKEIYEKNKTSQFVDESRVLTVVSHTNDWVLHLGSLYLPEGTKVYRHGKKNENGFIAHAKAPDCCQAVADLEFVKHDNQKRVKFYLWKISKPFLFALVLLLNTLALPIRIAIKTVEVLTSSCEKNKLESPTSHQNAAFEDLNGSPSPGQHLKPVSKAHNFLSNDEPAVSSRCTCFFRSAPTTRDLQRAQTDEPHANASSPCIF